MHTQQRPTLVDGIVGLVQQGQLQCQAQREKHRHRHQHMQADHPGLGQPDHVDGPHRGVNHECGSGEEGEGRAHPTGVILGVVGPRVTKPQQDADDAARSCGGDRNGHPAQDGLHQETPPRPGMGEQAGTETAEQEWPVVVADRCRCEEPRRQAGQGRRGAESQRPESADHEPVQGLRRPAGRPRH